MSKLAWRLWVPLLMLALWQVASAFGVLNPIFLPAPSVLIQSFMRMAQSGELFRSVGATLARTAGGFAIGAGVGVGIGLLMGSMPRVRRSLQPVISGLNATPKLVLLPLLMVLFGIGEPARVTLIALTAFLITTIHAVDAIGQIHPAWVEMAGNYGATRGALIREVYLPACLPQVFTGLRLALANALVIAVSCELVSPSTGLGSTIWLAWQTFSTDRLYVAILLTAVLGGVLHETLAFVERLMIPWRAADDR